MVEVSLTVGKLDASLALLLTKDHHLIEFPTILLPNGVKAGSIVKISCERDLDTEEKERKQFLAVQDEILTTFGKNLPKAPVLRIKNVTQTSCVLEWDPLDLGTASLKSLTLFKDGKKLGAIPQPLSNRTSKLSGLPIEKQFQFQLKLDSTAGVYLSETIEVTTHKMTDLSGIHVCLGDISANEQFTIEDIQQALKSMGAHYPASDKMKIETTHFVTTRENKQNPQFLKANDMNIPIIRPEWLKACEMERRIVGVRDFYVKECVLPDILAKNFWKKPASGVSVDVPRSGKQTEEPKPVLSSEKATNSENVPDSSDVPSLAVSAPSSDSQDLETPQNTPTDAVSEKNQDEGSKDVAESADGAINDTELVVEKAPTANLEDSKEDPAEKEDTVEDSGAKLPEKAIAELPVSADEQVANITTSENAETLVVEAEIEDEDLDLGASPVTDTVEPIEKEKASSSLKTEKEEKETAQDITSTDPIAEELSVKTEENTDALLKEKVVAQEDRKTSSDSKLESGQSAKTAKVDDEKTETAESASLDEVSL